jgi:integrase/recombinase XerD
MIDYRYNGQQMLDFDIDIPNVEKSAKVDGHGQGKILTDEELTELFTNGFQSERDRALFAICLFTGCRISEAVQLTTADISEGLITFRKGTVKGKTATRQAPITSALQHWLDEYEAPTDGYLFPGRHGRGHLTRAAADLLLKQACAIVEIEGVSTHSFRRTYITRLRNRGYSPKQIQRATGHKQLSSLLHYFDQV